MKGPQSSKHELYFTQEKERLTHELKKKLSEAIYETEKEILAQFNLYINDLFNQLFTPEDKGKDRTSWFKKALVDKFKYDKRRYTKGSQVDGFMKNILPNIQQEFQIRYESADERNREERYFDLEFVLDPDPEEIIRLLALHDAYAYFFQHKGELLNEAIESLEKEKFLVEENHFNKLSPIEVLEYMEQLQQTNPETKEPFLDEKKIYDLTNMICRNQPVVEPIVINISNQQKRQVIVFFYIFYKHYKNTKDAKASRDEYIDLLKRYVANFEQDQIYSNNFYLKKSDQPLLIKVDAKYLRWMNA